MSLVEERSLGAKSEEFTLFLKAVVKDECGSMPALEFATIRYARLDKLLSDIVNLANRQAAFYHQSRIDPSLSERLQRFWVARFRERYFNLDQSRYQTLAKTGRLRDVVFDETSGTDWQFWQAGSYRILSELEGNRQFEPGHWWLNLACAHRDGIVGSIHESPTKGKYGVAALPLMTGREEICTTAGTVRYMREAKLSGTHVALISQVGFQIRLLRGHGLRSPLAPKAGIRYDGLYKISQYGVKKIPQSSLYRVVLTFERIPGQRPLHELIKIPRPSHLDDWQLFERYEGEMIRQKCGEQLFLDWKMMKAQERMDQRQWRRAIKVGATLALRKASKNSRSTMQDHDRDHNCQNHNRNEDLDQLGGDVDLKA
ncbi:hypothetical protein ESCO_006774 [Escovopsis weberi]|uniref:YDG domain-containing protein n=1 Tax=Escovopsis weberi TaxID=150374 RepID=A0A0M9VVR2_ESCWE|nr:hypothetical protein ESCO_006774 [Escovopsis weberi]